MRRSFESAQYISIKYSERLAKAGIEPSVGSVGDSYDNAFVRLIVELAKQGERHRVPLRDGALPGNELADTVSDAVVSAAEFAL